MSTNWWTSKLVHEIRGNQCSAQWSKTDVWVEKSQNALKFPKIDMIYDILGYYLGFYTFTVFKQCFGVNALD